MGQATEFDLMLGQLCPKGLMPHGLHLFPLIAVIARPNINPLRTGFSDIG